MASLISVCILVLAFSISLEISSSRKVRLKTKDARIPETILHSKNESSSVGVDPSKVIQLSWHPRAFLYKSFLSDEECGHLISLAHDKVRSTDIGNSTASTGIILSRSQDETISKIEKRISAWTFLPEENGEGMQILRHGKSESHAPYYDYLNDETKLASGGHRVATVLMYLSNVAHGGETVFPKSQQKETQAKDETFSDCAKTGYSVKPVKGDALLFFSLHPSAMIDESSLHGDCMVLEGEKWLATKWIRVKAFNTGKSPTPPSVTNDGCTDEDDNCSNWAATGECQKNPVFMLGSPDYYGSCRKSCGVC